MREQAIIKSILSFKKLLFTILTFLSVQSVLLDGALALGTVTESRTNKASTLPQTQEPITAFEIIYDGYETVTYNGCGQCIAYFSSVDGSASIVLYERGNQAYWTLTIRPREGLSPYVQFYFVDRSSKIPQKIRGTYYPVYDVTDYFDLKKMELKPGGIIAGKLNAVKAKSLGTNNIATFSGSFEIQLR